MGVPEGAKGDPCREDEPYFEEIGGGLIEDRPRVSSAWKAGSQDYHADGVGGAVSGVAGHSGPFRRAAANVFLALRDAASDLKSVGTWLGVVAGLAIPAALAAAIGWWALNDGWLGEHLLVAVNLVLAAMLTVSAAVYGTIVGFRAQRSGSPGGAWAVRTAAFLALAGPILFVLGVVGGGSTATTLSAVVAILLELSIFGALGQVRPHYPAVVPPVR